MKIIKGKRQKDFTPFTITLAIERESDANALYSIFNHGVILNAGGINPKDSESIRDYIIENMPKQSDLHDFHIDFCKKLEENFIKGIKAYELISREVR